MDNYYHKGYRHGKNAGSWVTDGNTTTEMYRWIREGFDNGDPEVMDLQPAPLSGEWAGESIAELFGLKAGEKLLDDDALTEYEEGFAYGFWESVIKACDYQLTNN